MNYKYLYIVSFGLLLLSCSMKPKHEKTSNKSLETFYNVDSNGDSSLVINLSIECDSLKKDKERALAVIGPSTSTYNPKIDDEYFFPESDSTISKDTIIDNYLFTYSLVPIKDRITITYTEYLNSEKKKIVRDKIKYRDYFILFSAKNKKSGEIFEKAIYKTNIGRLVNAKLQYQFIRDVEFTEHQNDTFIFAIILKPNNSKQIDYKIKLIYNLENNLMIEDYPESFYETF